MNGQKAEFEQFQKDVEYAESRHDELLDRYPNQWAAILHQKVVGTGPDVYKLIEELRVKGVPTERTVLRHLTREGELLIL